MRCPSLEELPSPPPGKAGWPWTEESRQLSEKMADGSPWPRISIVTPSLNQGRFIEETIRSVLLQGYPDLEYIVIDGGSNDCSVDIIRKYESWLAFWANEPDDGQSHGINRGFKEATGSIGAWINSDDLYEPDIFGEIAVVFSHPSSPVLVYGDCTNVDERGRGFSISVSQPFDQDQLIRERNFISQPTAFFLLRAFGQLGGLDTSLDYAMDYDLWIRLGKEGCAFHVPSRIARFRSYPDSKTGQGPHTYWPELRTVSLRHGGGLLSPMYIKHMRDRFYVFRQKIKQSIVDL